MEVMRTIFSTTETAQHLNVSPSYARRLARTGALPAIRVGAGWVFERGVVELASRQRGKR